MDKRASDRWLERDKAALAAVLPRYNDLVVERAEGSWLYTVDGETLLDLGSGIAVNSTGHCHPRVVEAITNQARTLIHTSVTAHHQLNIELAERLGELTSFEDPQVFFCNSGAEAVDGSLKLARYVTGQSGITAFQGSFHGRTIAATSLTTSKGKYRQGYSPYLPYVYHVSYNCDLKLLDELLASGPPKFPYRIGAIIVEPILGEGGYVPASETWLKGLRERCDGVNRLLIFDEVQTGVFRTGFPFAAQYYGVCPDVILFAKGIASGMPLGGIIAEKTTMDKWEEGKHGSTFGGNPVSCAAALATLDVLESLGNSVRLAGANTRLRLREEQPYPVRGVGLMIGINLPDKDFATKVVNLCREGRVLVLTCGPEDRTIRLIPPLTIADDELDFGLHVLIGAINAVHKSQPENRD